MEKTFLKILKFTDFIFDSQTKIKEWSDKIKTLVLSLSRKEVVEKELNDLHAKKVIIQELTQEYYKYKSDFDNMTIRKSLLLTEEKELKIIESKIQGTKATVDHYKSLRNQIAEINNEATIDLYQKELAFLKESLAEENFNEKP